MHLVTDNAAGHLMYENKVDVVLFGADRVAANGNIIYDIILIQFCIVIDIILKNW